jgi:predicted XRE-type DNA-binding protein
MKKTKAIVTRNAKELAEALGLSPAEGIEIEVRSDLNDKIIEVVKKKGLTHAQVAKLAKTSRTRVTALLNRNSKDISTDLMLRILGAIGVQAKIHFKSRAA